MKAKFAILTFVFIFFIFMANAFATSLTLVTNPPQSMVYVNNVLVGQTNIYGKITFEVSAGANVKVENIGYFPYTFVFKSTAPATVQVNLKQISYIFIDSTPSDAQAIVDGSEYALPATITVAAGNHEVIVEKDGYVPQKTTIVSQPFGIVKKHFKLEKAGKVVITTTPPHATLLLDDENNFITPFSTYLQSGTHSLSFSAEGYSPLSTRVYIPKNATPINLHFNLKKLLTVTIDSSPSGAAITMASTTFVAPCTLTLNEGVYKYSAQQEYAYPATGEINVKESGKYVVKLKPKMGLVVFTSNPMGAAVTLNGKFIGQTQKSMRLPYGKYEVKMVGNDGKVWFGRFVLNQEIKNVYGDMINSGMVIINSYPSTNTIVHIGQVWTSVPATLNAAVGVYKVEFFNSHYPTLSRYVEIKPGEVSKVDVSLQPMSTFFVMSYPLGAEVSLDGKEIGKAPIFGEKVEAKTHLLHIKWDDGEVEKKILLIKDKVYTFSFTDPNSVKITFISYPDPLTLKIDGKEKGQTPISIQLTRGKHSYEAYNALGDEVESGMLNTTYFSSETYFFLSGR